jgi:hypothetical protein
LWSGHRGTVALSDRPLIRHAMGGLNAGNRARDRPFRAVLGAPTVRGGPPLCWPRRYFILSMHQCRPRRRDREGADSWRASSSRGSSGLRRHGTRTPSRAVAGRTRGLRRRRIEGRHHGSSPQDQASRRLALRVRARRCFSAHADRANRRGDSALLPPHAVPPGLRCTQPVEGVQSRMASPSRTSTATPPANSRTRRAQCLRTRGSRKASGRATMSSQAPRCRNRSPAGEARNPKARSLSPRIDEGSWRPNIISKRYSVSTGPRKTTQPTDRGVCLASSARALDRPLPSGLGQ